MRPSREYLTVMMAQSAACGFPRYPLNGVVYQSFKRAINIRIPQSGAIYSLVALGCDNGPDCCRLSLEQFPPVLRPGDEVNFHSEGMGLGQQYWVDYSRCQIWHGPVITLAAGQWRNICWRTWCRRLTAVAAQGRSLFNPGIGLGIYHTMAQQLHRQRQAILTGLINNSWPESAVNGLIGLGIGLTPSGDDWLSGFCSVFLLPGHPGEHYRQRFLYSLITRRAQTTALSAMMLEKTLCRQYRENIAALLQTMINNEPDTFIRASAKVQLMGASSGCDMLFGMADACAITHQIGETNAYKDSY